MKPENYGSKTYSQMWEGMATEEDRKKHITPKPLGLLKHLLQVANPGDVVLDPFAGGSSTLEAARELGLSAIGFEVTEHYYNISKKRIEEKYQQVLF